ncbi:hypothetical protein [Bradyrhizobium sp. 1]|uniref:hypothetical protein n=1 Tax=Bradyrhizobium sp. 1 TaxID=241591 RepID=UPI001FFA608A|nr:hypothetical protein [Bradyrhizobium sp. 1]MCK1394296.1 hypothetical protein [Bradyrhizobium sp. 1]
MNEVLLAPCSSTPVADEHVRADAIGGSFTATLAFKMRCGLFRDVGGGMADPERMLKRGDFGQKVDMRRDLISLAHGNHVPGHYLPLGSPMLCNIPLRHRLEILDIAL